MIKVKILETWDDIYYVNAYNSEEDGHFVDGHYAKNPANVKHSNILNSFYKAINEAKANIITVNHYVKNYYDPDYDMPSTGFISIFTYEKEDE